MIFGLSSVKYLLCIACVNFNFVSYVLEWIVLFTSDGDSSVTNPVFSIN